MVGFTQITKKNVVSVAIVFAALNTSSLLGMELNSHIGINQQLSQFSQKHDVLQNGNALSFSNRKHEFIYVYSLEQRDLLSSGNTAQITAKIDRGKTECASLPAEYQVDCLSQVFKSAARVAGRFPEYSKPKKELELASSRLSNLVAQNEDKSKPAITKNGKTFRAVKTGAIKKVSSKAAAIITETETKILRSAGNSALKQIHFSKIAKAVGSTKILLRSV